MMHLDAIECLTINKVEIVLGIRILVDNRFEFPGYCLLYLSFGDS